MEKWSVRTAGRSLLLCLLAFGFVALARTDARADMVTFSTAGCFTAGCTPGTMASFMSGGASAVFTNVGPVTVNTSTPSGFTNADLGQITVSGAGTFSSTPFTLVVTQTAPTAGTGTFTGTLTGTIIVNGSDSRIVFDQTFLTIGGINYQLVNLTGNTLFLDPQATGGITRITAQISSPVPEPATLLLLGTGLVGAGTAARRRRKTPAR